MPSPLPEFIFIWPGSKSLVIQVRQTRQDVFGRPLYDLFGKDSAVVRWSEYGYIELTLERTLQERKARIVDANGQQWTWNKRRKRILCVAAKGTPDNGYVCDSFCNGVRLLKEYGYFDRGSG